MQNKTRRLLTHQVDSAATRRLSTFLFANYHRNQMEESTIDQRPAKGTRCTHTHVRRRRMDDSCGVRIRQIRTGQTGCHLRTASKSQTKPNASTLSLVFGPKKTRKYPKLSQTFLRFSRPPKTRKTRPPKQTTTSRWRRRAPTETGRATFDALADIGVSTSGPFPFLSRRYTRRRSKITATSFFFSSVRCSTIATTPASTSSGSSRHAFTLQTQ